METNEKRGRPSKFDRKKALIVCGELFQIHGYDALSIATICKVLGITPTSLYAAYQSKKHLFTLVVDDLANQLSEEITSSLRNSQQPSEVLRNILELGCQIFCKQTHHPGHLIFDASIYLTDQDLKLLLINKVSNFEQIIAARLSELGDPNAKELSAAIVTFLRGLSASAKSGQSEDDLLITVEFFCAALDC